MNANAQLLSHPANQHAAELLRKENRPVEPHPLPVFQLMQLGLESPDLGFSPKYRPALSSAVMSASRNPDQASPLQFLLLTDSQEERDLSEYLAETDPIAGARLLLEELHSKLAATVPDYHNPAASL
jgi:hypothetical protein